MSVPDCKELTALVQADNEHSDDEAEYDHALEARLNSNPNKTLTWAVNKQSQLPVIIDSVAQCLSELNSNPSRTMTWAVQKRSQAPMIIDSVAQRLSELVTRAVNNQWLND